VIFAQQAPEALCRQWALAFVVHNQRAVLYDTSQAVHCHAWDVSIDNIRDSALGQAEVEAAPPVGCYHEIRTVPA
jgi:hypothetical protein